MNITKNGPAKLLVVGIALAFANAATAATSMVGVTVPWIEGQSGELPGRTDADTIPDNSGWNAYLRPVGGAFVNSGDSSGLRFSVDLSITGDYKYEVLLQHQSWVDGSVDNPGSYLNLYFNDDLVNPGISAKLSGGNTGVVLPLTTADLPLVNNDEGGMSAPSGSLTYIDGPTRVTLSNMTFSVVGDTVSSFGEFPSGSEQDSLIGFTLNVAIIPEPSSSLLALLGGALLLFRRRR